MDYLEESLKLHRENKGKLEIKSKIEINSKEDLALAYTPGVAEPCREIAKDKDKVYEYTAKSNLVAVVSDGSAVLGLGDIGPEASMPVMEGKAILFKEFGDVDAFPICLASQDVDKIVETVINIAPGFGGINLEDISAPRCVEIENRLREALDIPVFHDDQHGTAIVVSAGLINALKLANKKIEDIKVVINGAGAAGGAISKMLLELGVKNLLVCDRSGILVRDESYNNLVKDELAKLTNEGLQRGSLEDALDKADVFIGVLAGGVLKEDMVKRMNDKAIIFALANPVPEIYPDLAKKAGAFIVATGRSDFPNQINNVLAFPGIFRGALDARASEINEKMNVAAAYAIAEAVEEKDLNVENIMPSALDKKISEKVAKVVKEKAIELNISKL